MVGLGTGVVRTVGVLRLLAGVMVFVSLAVVKDVAFDIIEGNDVVFTVDNDVVFTINNDALFDMGIIVSLGFTEAERILVKVDEDEFVGKRVVGFVGIAGLADVEIFGLPSPAARRTMSWFFKKYLSGLSWKSSTNSDTSKKSKESK